MVVTSTGLDSFTGAEDAAGATAYHKSSPVDGEPRGEPETNDEATQRLVVADDDPVCSSPAYTPASSVHTSEAGDTEIHVHNMMQQLQQAQQGVLLNMPIAPAYDPAWESD